MVVGPPSDFSPGVFLLVTLVYCAEYINEVAMVE